MLGNCGPMQQLLASFCSTCAHCISTRSCGARCHWLHEKAVIAKPRPPCRKGTVSSVLKFATHAAHLENVTKIAKTGSATVAKQKQRSQMQKAHNNKLACITAEHSYALIKHLGCMHCCGSTMLKHQNCMHCCYAMIKHQNCMHCCCAMTKHQS